jgi:RNA:NAD 2'-phosphotransferase (TPT1/KptA family)
MDAAGYVKLDDVLSYLKHKKGYNNIHIKDIQAIVDTNDKKRF